MLDLIFHLVHQKFYFVSQQTIEDFTTNNGLIHFVKTEKMNSKVMKKKIYLHMFSYVVG